MSSIIQRCLLALSLVTPSAVMGAEPGFILDRKFAEHFAHDWIDSWNQHNLQRILDHYSDDIQLESPFIVLRGADPSGRLVGKEALTRYWSPVMAPNSTLRFERLNVLLSVNSVAILYKTNVGGDRLAVEVFHFNGEGKVSRSYAHYTDPLPK
jgi:ketosteroid isomerase-like protein